MWAEGRSPRYFAPVRQTLSYDALLDTLAARARHAPAGLSLVLIDGIPACGKSSLASALRERLQRDGHDAVVVENDWFIDTSIRSPLQIARGLLFALSGQPVDVVERALLDRFLDNQRLGRFQDELGQAGRVLAAGESATLAPSGAHWNLAHAPAWDPRSFELRPGGVVIIEGTLSRATYLERFPDALCVFVEAPVPVARARFLRRNAAPVSRRNFAFTLLARFGPAYRLAADMVGRDRHPCHIRVDLSELSAPSLIEGRAQSAG